MYLSWSLGTVTSWSLDIIKKVTGKSGIPAQSRNVHSDALTTVSLAALNFKALILYQEQLMFVQPLMYSAGFSAG